MPFQDAAAERRKQLAAQLLRMVTQRGRSAPAMREAATK